MTATKLCIGCGKKISKKRLRQCNFTEWCSYSCFEKHTKHATTKPIRQNNPRKDKIYRLRDPFTKEIRYVGYTAQSLETRLRQHLEETANPMKWAWVRDLKRAGAIPLIELVSTDFDDWQKAEKYWIAHYRKSGCDLLNIAAGGRGYHPVKPTNRNLDRAYYDLVMEWSNLK